MNRSFRKGDTFKDEAVVGKKNISHLRQAKRSQGAPEKKEAGRTETSKREVMESLHSRELEDLQGLKRL